MRRDAGDASRLGVGLDELPDHLFPKAFADYSVGAIHGPKHVTVGDARRKRPRVDSHFNPSRHRRGSDPTMLADQFHDAPTTVALLEMREHQRGNFGPPQAATEEHS
jgi:hypothetical protein